MSKVSNVFILIALLIAVIPPIRVNAQSTIQCGDIIEGEFASHSETQYYQIELNPGDVLTVDGKALGDYLQFYMGVHFGSQSGSEVASSVLYYSNPSVQTGVLSMGGTYIINVHSGGSPGGLYTLYVGCTLRDGTVINPGDNVPEITPSDGPTATFSGYGFPGIAPIDFSQAIAISIAKGQAQPGALGSSRQDIFAYNFTVDTNSSATLSVRRTSGNLSIGVAVINQADNSVIFLAGMPSSGNMSVQLDFPSPGTYVVGIFRLDIAPSQVGTSGAFEVRLD